MYQRRLVRASFRGFEFKTESHEAKYGRRLVTHEYPKADEPELEDFGAKANTWRLNAYFIGADYDLEANEFLARLSQPGADWLAHPWLGQLWVRAQDWSRTESNDKNGYCTITIEFVAGGRAPYQPVVDKVDVAYSRVNALRQAVMDDFDLKPMSNDAITAFAANISQHLEHIRNAISLATLPLTWANQALSIIQGVKNDINVLLQLPQQYANALGSFANVLGLGADSLADDVPGETRSRAVARLTDTAINPPAIVPDTATATISADYNINTLRDTHLRSQMLIIAAVQIAIADYTDSATRDAVLNTLVNAIDAQLPNMSDAVFDAATNARAALIDALLDQDLASLVARDIVNALPSVILAYQMQVEETTFIAKNGVRHPLFVQGHVYG